MGATYPFMTSRSLIGAGFDPANSDRQAIRVDQTPGEKTGLVKEGKCHAALNDNDYFRV